MGAWSWGGAEDENLHQTEGNEGWKTQIAPEICDPGVQEEFCLTPFRAHDKILRRRQMLLSIPTIRKATAATAKAKPARRTGNDGFFQAVCRRPPVKPDVPLLNCFIVVIHQKTVQIQGNHHPAALARNRLETMSQESDRA